MTVVREDSIRLRIQAVSELPEIQDQFSSLIDLQKQLIEATKQSALSARTGSIQQVEAIQGVTQALKDQEAQNRRTGDGAAGSAKQQADALKTLEGGVRSLTSLIATAFTVDAVKSFASDVIDAKTQIDSVKIALDTMLGSKKAEEEMYQQFVQLAKTSPFDLETITEQGKKLLAYNVSAQDLIPTLTNLGNVASAVGLEKLPQITLAYGQIMNTGRLMGTETKQLIEAGIDIYGLLSTALGKTRQEVQKMAADHTIMAEDVKKAFEIASAEGGKYAGMMAKLSTTVGGQISNLSDIFFQAKGRIGDFFEGSIRDGITATKNLMEATIGSNSAITRSLDIIKSVATAVLTYTVATKAQAVADGIVNAYTATKNVLYGEYLLAMRAITEQQIVFTAAETEAVVAAEALNGAIRSNPIGAITALVMAGVSAWYGYKAATDEVTSVMGEQELKIKQEQTELNTLTKAAMLESNSKEDRVRLINLLIEKYPDYFKGINAEKIGNVELMGILDKVNEMYTQRINKAREAYNADKIAEKQTVLFKAEEDLFARVKATGVISDEVLAGMGGSVVKLSEYIASMGEKATLLNSGWDTFVKGTIGESTRKLVAQQKDLEAQSLASNQRVIGYNADAQKAAVDLEVERWNNTVVNLKKGSKAYEDAEEAHQIALQKIYGTYKEKTEKAAVDQADKMKSITLVSAKEIAAIKAEGDAEEEQDRTKQLKEQLAFLDKQEAADIEAVNKIKVNKKISNDALAALQAEGRQKIAAIDAEYDKKRADILTKIEEEAANQYVAKIQESNDKVQLMTAKRLEAEAILTKLNDAKTNTERLAALKDYQEKYKENVNQALVDERATQLAASAKAVNDLIAEGNDKGAVFRKAYSAYLKDNEAYNQALEKQSTDSAKETAKTIEDYEKEIQTAKKETAKLEKETLEQQKQTRTEFLNGIAQLVSQDSGLMGQLAGGVISAYNAFENLGTKALATSKTNLANAQNDLQAITAMYADGSAKGDAAIATATANVSKAKSEAAKAEGVSTQAALSLIGTVYQVMSTIEGAINEAERARWQTMADSFAKMREGFKSLYDFIKESSDEAYKNDVDNFKGSINDKLSLIKGYYADLRETSKTQNQMDDQLAYFQFVAQVYADTVTDAKKAIQDIKDYDEAQQKNKIDRLKQEAETEKQEAADVRDAKLKALDDVFDAFKDSIEKQEDLAKDAADKEKDAVNDLTDKKVDAVNAALDAAKDAYSKQVDAVKDSYDKQLDALRTKEDAERDEIQKTYDLKQSLLEQATSDEIEKITILDNYRMDALNRYQTDESAKLVATRDRILATLTDEGERAQVTADFERQLKELHDTVEEAKLDKSKGVSLATTQLNQEAKDKAEQLKTEESNTLTTLANNYQTLFTNLANERDQTLQKMKEDEETRETDLKNQITQIKADGKAEVQRIEQELADKIKSLQQEIADKEADTTQAKILVNYQYKQAIEATNQAIFESQKQLTISQLQAQIAILNSQKSWTGIGNGKINDAINQLNDAIAQISGTVLKSTITFGDFQQAYGYDGGFAKNTIYTKDPNTGKATPIGSGPYYADNGREIDLSYSDDLSEHTIYDANHQSMPVLFATAKYKDDGTKYFFEGTPFVDGFGFPDGRDTVPAMVNKGERIIPTSLNEQLGGRSLTNEELVSQVTGYQRLLADYPSFINASVIRDLSAGIRLPESILNANLNALNSQQISEMTMHLKGVRTDLQSMKTELKTLKQVHVNVDKGGISTLVKTAQSRTTYLDNLFQQ